MSYLSKFSFQNLWNSQYRKLLVLSLVAGVMSLLSLTLGIGVLVRPYFNQPKTIAQKMLLLADKPEQREELASLAQARKSQLDILYAQSPDSFLAEATLTQKRNIFPEELKAYIEDEVKVQDALLTAVHIDIADSAGVYAFQLHHQKETLNVRFAGEIQGNVSAGAKITARAVGIDGKYVIDLNDDSLKMSPPPVAYLTGEQKYLVIPVKFQDDTGEPMTQQEIESIILGSTNSLKDYYAGASYNQIQFTATVTDWLTLDINNKLLTCQEGENPVVSKEVKEIIDKAFAEAAEQNIDTAVYNNYLLVVNSDANCSGLGSVGRGSGSTTFSLVFKDALREMFVYAHEVGHNFTLEHARALVCKDKFIKAGFIGCDFNEYGDESDVMGSSFGPAFLGGWSKTRLQLVTPYPISTSGEYTLKSISRSNGSDVAAKIPLNDGLFYILTYRQSNGYDSLLDGRFFNGVSIQIVNGNYSYILSPIAGSYTYGAPLTDGLSVYDDVNSIKFTQLSHSNDSVKFKVEFGFQPPTVSPSPSSSGGPSPSPSRGPSPSPSRGPSPSLRPSPSSASCYCDASVGAAANSCHLNSAGDGCWYYCPSDCSSWEGPYGPSCQGTCTQACPVEKNTQFWYGCPGEPYEGCGGLQGWVSGSEVQSANPQPPFDLDINCFANYGNAFNDARIELVGPDGKTTTYDDWEARDIQITQQGLYTAKCVHTQNPSCSDQDSFTLGGTGNPPSCPYTSTQAQIQKNSSQPWDDSVVIKLGESVNLGGFHNGTGWFAGDPVNTYQPNETNVDFYINGPGLNNVKFAPNPGYPVIFTPLQKGIYSFTGKTKRSSGYYTGSNCRDSGTITVE